MTWKRAQEFMRRHAVIPVAVLAILGVILVERLDFRSLVASTGTFNNAQAVVFIAPRDEVFMVDRVLWLDVRIHADVPINAVGATLAFDPAALEVVGFSKEDSFFDLWAEETSIREESGEVHFSGGTLGRDGFEGTDTILTLSIRPKREGETVISFKDAAILAADGRGSPVVHERQPLVLAVHSSTSTLVSASSTHFVSDFNDDGRITAADLSLFTVQLFLPYNELYDLDKNGFVELADLRVFIEDLGR